DHREQAGAGVATAVVADPQGNLYVGGSHFWASMRRGVVLRLNELGVPVWQCQPAEGENREINALGYGGGRLYVTGLVGAPGGDGAEPQQGIFLSKLDPQTGVVQWIRVVEKRPDPLQLTTGLSLDISPEGRVVITGTLYQPGETLGDWFV